MPLRPPPSDFPREAARLLEGTREGAAARDVAYTVAQTSMTRYHCFAHPAFADAPAVAERAGI